MLHPWGLTTYVNELTVATNVMQSTSNELSFSVSVSVKYKQTENLMHIWQIPSLTSRLLMAAWLSYQADVNLPSFDPSWRHLTCLVTLMRFDTTKHDYIYILNTLTYIYIYIYIANYIINITLYLIITKNFGRLFSSSYPGLYIKANIKNFQNCPPSQTQLTGTLKKSPEGISAWT